jgi:hypothetical protein
MVWPSYNQSIKRQADEAAHQAFHKAALSHMTQRNYAPPDNYDNVQVDYEVSDAEFVDPYESYNAVLQPAPATFIPSFIISSSSRLSHTSTYDPATKKVRCLDEVIKVQTDDFCKLAENVGKAPAKYVTPEEEIRSTDLF